MDQYYKILGLETTATLEEVEKRFNELYKEYDPNKQDDLKDFFKKEQEKVQEAYNEISLSFIRQKEEVEEEVIVKDKDEKNIEDEIKEKIGIEPLYTKQEKVEEKQQIDILNNIKSFSSLKKFTICSVFFSIILLFLPWTGEISPIELVEMKDNLFDTIDIDDVPLRLNLSFYFGYITTSFLIFTIFIIYKSNYRFASLLYLFNLVVLFLIITSNLLYFANGEYRNWIEDEASIKKLPKEERRHSKRLNKKQIKVIYLNFVEEELEEMYDDYDIKDYKLKNRTFSALSWYPILFILLFLTNWILISILSRRKRLEISR